MDACHPGAAFFLSTRPFYPLSEASPAPRPCPSPVPGTTERLRQYDGTAVRQNDSTAVRRSSEPCGGCCSRAAGSRRTQYRVEDGGYSFQSLPPPLHGATTVTVSVAVTVTVSVTVTVTVSVTVTIAETRRAGAEDTHTE